MQVTVTMSDDEFIEFKKFEDYKRSIKCGIIDLKDTYNDLLKILLESGSWEDGNKVDKLVKRFNTSIIKLEHFGGIDNDNTNT